MSQLKFEEETFVIRGAVFEVYRTMGCGFLEAFIAQQELRLCYKGQVLRQFYKPDLICFGKIIVELKAVSALSGEHQAQVLNYLKATGYEVGLLVNFGCHPKAIVERLVL